jgi:chlorite dismutase
MNEPLYVVVYTLKFNDKFWGSADKDKASVIENAERYISDLRHRLNHLKTYSCARHDADLILWASSMDTNGIQLLKNQIGMALGAFSKMTYSLLSIYESSPYLHKGKEIENEFDQPPLKYFIAYPMSKTPEWYLLPYDERKKIMADHIRMATTNPENVGIRSFTTYSYGLGDQEFVVMYEADSLLNWSHVTAKLREATARRWIVKEEPIFVGSHIDSLKDLRLW